MKPIVLAHRRPSATFPASRRAIARGITALGVTALGVTAGTAAADPVAPSRLTLTQFDGTPRFDESDSDGTDSGPSNGVVRLGDTVTYVLDIAVGDRPLADAQVNLPIPAALGLAPARVPAFCLPGSALVVGADHRQSLQCLLGDLEPGTTLTRTVLARADTATAVGTVAEPVTATLSSPSLPVPLLSEPVALQFTGPNCDPRGVPDPAGPAGTAGTVRADGRIDVHVVDPHLEPTPVDITGHDACGHRITRTVASGPDGRAVFAGLMPGRYRVSAPASGGTGAAGDWVEVLLGGSDPRAALTLPARPDTN